MSFIPQLNQFSKKAKISNKFSYLILLLSLQFYLVTPSNYFDSFQITDLNDQSSLVDFADYSNSYIFITTSKKIYAGINPQYKSTITAKINKYTFGVSYDENYILLACLDDSLLSKVNINTGVTTSLLSYEEVFENLRVPNHSCSLSYYDNFAYIVFSFGYDIEDPFDYCYKEEEEEEQETEYEEDKEEYESEELEERGEFEEEQEFLEKEEKTEEVLIEEKEEMEVRIEFKEEQQLEEKEEMIEEVEIEEKEEEFVKNETKNNKTEEEKTSKGTRNLGETIVENYVKNYAIKIKLNDTNDGPIIDETYKILFYHFDYELNLTNITYIKYYRHISCEVINPINKDDPRLVCGYIIYYENAPFKVIFIVFNKTFDGFEQTNKLNYTISSYSDFILQRINSNYLRYTQAGSSYKINLESSGDTFSFKSNGVRGFSTTQNLFFYNNEHIFTFNLTCYFEEPTCRYYYFFIYKDNKGNYIREYIQYNSSEKIEKVMGYFNTKEDKYLIIYKSVQTIKYFTFENMTLLYNLNCGYKDFYHNSTSPDLVLNVTELISNAHLYSKMRNLWKALYVSQFQTLWSFTGSFKFNETSQILTVYKSENNWLYFKFGYTEWPNRNNKGYTFEVIPSNCHYNIRTCNFKCGTCYKGYEKCDEGSCRNNFAVLRGSTDKTCYPNDQNFFDYIYNSTTNYYEKCYETCRFCSLMGNVSSISSQHCKNCTDGYLKSYEYSGNCYKIDNSTINNTIKKIVNKIDDENYTIVDSCLETNKIFTVVETGECVSQCPQDYIYYNYTLNETINLNNVGTSHLTPRYPMYLLEIPKYLFGNLCFISCPSYTNENNSTLKCDCFYNWHQNSTTKEITCYNNNTTYCTYDDYYRYYLDDTRECVHKTCPSNYYMFYFQCYSNSCPNDTISNDNNQYICDSTYNYCYIDENYQNHCQDNKFNTHKYQYNYTKLYFESCNESLFLYDIKTYLYSNICLTDCPEQTEIDSTNNSCICKYYIYYLDTNREYYSCLLKNEACEDRNLFPVIEIKECLTTLNDCKRKGYKIFNNQCYLTCPNNTELQDDNYTCFCSYHYFINSSDLLTCFDSNITCEEKGFFVNNLDNRECLNSTDVCIKKGYKIFNGQCYVNCPINTELQDDNYTCFCSYHYFVVSNNMFICFNSDKTCEDEGYPVTNLDNKECLNSTNDCIIKSYPIFNDNCYINCPINTKLNSSIHSCVCSYYYHIENNTYSCFDKDKTCKDKGFHAVNVENKECLLSINDCILKDYKIFNNECYFNCPVNTEKLFNSSFCFCSFNYFNNSDSTSTCFNQNQNCKSQGHPIRNIDNKQCLNSLDECIANNYFIFNNNCYTSCPKSTIINETNENYCICEYSYKIDQITNEIQCAEFPDEYYKSPEACHAIYKGKCYEKCPENTCFLSTDNSINCIDIKPNVKVVSGICFEDYTQVLNNIKNMTEDVKVIKTDVGANISIYYADSSMEELIKKNPYTTFIDLGECGDLLKKFYGLPPETQLGVIVVDCPDNNNMTSINDFSYEIYLENGTQLQNLSVCKKIKTSSFIKEPDKVKLNTAENFFTQGYDIYNLSDSFYTNHCAPAVDSEGNDITLKDRMKDIYLRNVSLCASGCTYNKVDFETQRFICECGDEEGDESYEVTLFSNSTDEGISYLEYFLSLINYKIVTCNELLLTPNNYFYNIGLYIGVSITVICLIEILIFSSCGIQKIKKIFLDNFPNKYKLKELIKEQEKIRLNSLRKEKNGKIKPIRKGFSNKQLARNSLNGKKSKTIAKLRVNKKSNTCKNNPPKKKKINLINKNIKNSIENEIKNDCIRNKKRNKTTQINNLEKFKNSLDNLQSSNREDRIKGIKRNKLKQDLKNNNKNNNNKNKNLKKKLRSQKNIKCIISMDENPFKNDNNIKKRSNIKCLSKIQKKNSLQPLIEVPTRKKNKNKTEKKEQSFNVIRNINSKNIRNCIKQKTTKTSRRLYIMNQRKSIQILKQELVIDMKFRRLIFENDKNVDKDELNDIPFSQAIRLDKRNYFQIFFSFFSKEVDLLKLFAHFHPFSHFSLLSSVYFTELLLDLALNCLFYSDDVVSEKYHNNGEIKYFTTLYLSTISNMFSSFIIFLLEKLTVYEEILESIIKEVKIKNAYLANMQRFLKYIKIRIGFFYLIQIIMNCAQTYYLFVFCTVYHKSQSSIAVNYIFGMLESLAISFGISFINAFLRLISLRTKSNNLYNTSKFIADKF